jgi:hypothetical protein
MRQKRRPAALLPGNKAPFWRFLYIRRFDDTDMPMPLFIQQKRRPG